MGTEKKLFIDHFESPLGDITLLATDSGLAGLYLKGQSIDLDKDICLISKPNFVLAKAKFELRKYFDKELKEFSVPLDLCGTDFQLRVWTTLRDIKYGETKTYKEVAKEIGLHSGFQAIGNANKKNPIAIIIPCHRVIGTNKKLVGYDGGITLKKQLLEHEEVCIYVE